MSCTNCKSGPYRSNTVKPKNETKINMNSIKAIFKIVTIENVICTILLFIFLTLGWWIIFYNPKVDYCSLELSSGYSGLYLRGNRPFAIDKYYGLISTTSDLTPEVIEKAKNISKELDCEFEK